MEMASLLSLQEENQLLQQELSRVEDLLAQSRAERDELDIKYNVVSERSDSGQMASQSVQEAGLGLITDLRLAESRTEAALEKQAQLEEQLQDKMLHEKDLAQQQMQSDLDEADLSATWVPGGCCIRQASLQKSDRAGPGSGASSEAESGEGSGQQGPHREA
ncbi:rootletin [Macaca thibetana thibetana]|uniref:rootletin n=1 Tax=Macaca thibetana thibetana TaxID=257877 RepID=UPI0021BC9804|nr:rootletin [Macaca thibetana thibetana]